MTYFFLVVVFFLLFCCCCFFIPRSRFVADLLRSGFFLMIIKYSTYIKLRPKWMSVEYDSISG